MGGSRAGPALAGLWPGLLARRWPASWPGVGRPPGPALAGLLARRWPASWPGLLAPRWPASCEQVVSRAGRGQGPWCESDGGPTLQADGGTRDRGHDGNYRCDAHCCRRCYRGNSGAHLRGGSGLVYPGFPRNVGGQLARCPFGGPSGSEFRLAGCCGKPGASVQGSGDGPESCREFSRTGLPPRQRSGPPPDPGQMTHLGDAFGPGGIDRPVAGKAGV